MVTLAPDGDRRIEPQGLQCRHGRLTVLPIIQGRRNGLGGTQLILWALNTRLV
jgi:hypothetical protein